MYLWLLKPVDEPPEGDNPWKPYYDKAFGFVVRAETEQDARRLATEKGGDEVGPRRESAYRIGGDPWLDAKYSTCERLTDAGEPGVIIINFASA